jgi:hypothetical protein
MGGAIAREGEHESAFSSRGAAYSLLTVGIAGVPGVESHTAEILDAMAPWTGGPRLPNFTFTPEEYVDAYDGRTVARLRAAIRSYDPHGVMAIGRVLVPLAPRGSRVVPAGSGRGPRCTRGAPRACGGTRPTG